MNAATLPPLTRQQSADLALRDLWRERRERDKRVRLASIRQSPEHWCFCTAGLPIIGPDDDDNLIEDKRTYVNERGDSWAGCGA